MNRTQTAFLVSFLALLAGGFAYGVSRVNVADAGLARCVDASVEAGAHRDVALRLCATSLR